AKPDWDNSEFILFMGTSPAQAGNPFKRQARQLAKQRTESDFDYVVVSPRLELTSTQATQNNRWLPILPGGDLALSLAMLRWIIENERYNATYLARPSEFAMQQAGQVSYCNASHLFIADEQHPRFGQPIIEQDLFDAEQTTAENNIVKNAETQRLEPAKSVLKAELWVNENITLKDGSAVLVKSALTLLKEACLEHSLEEYSTLCGIPVKQIVALADKFTSYGHKSVAITHGGTMQSNGFYTSWAILLLNVMVGNMNKKGGMSMSGGKFKDFASGPRYNLATFPDMVKPRGTNLARSKKSYENSSEYKRKLAQGKPYPARAAWYPFVGGQMSEMITSALQGYPYSLKAWISHMSNPLYGLTGIHHIVEEKLRDTKILPLFIAIDAFMNETTAFADYIVPDTHNFESWGFSTPWAGVPTKTSTARWPVIQSANVKNAQGETVCMESFIIQIAKAMGLPGFGENAISDTQQKTYPLNCSEDFFLRAAVNIAFDGKEPVKDASAEDRLLSGVERIMPLLNKVLKDDEVLKAATIFCKGGRFSPFNSAWEGENMSAKWKRCLQIWNPTVAKARHHHNGKHYHGCPKYYPAQFADNSTVESHYPKQEWPFELISFKSNLISSITAPLLRLHNIKPNGIVAISGQDARKWNLTQGDLVELSTPGGKAQVQLMVLDGVMPGVIAIEHGYGHKQLGATSYEIDGKVIRGNQQIQQGININDLGLLDETKEIKSPWLDWVCGSAVRQSLPARLKKI
ncbi:molybdopterin-dependent oxidoreductase, partial [Avibacterium avium]|uniref:molybdopterin-dependent oxidoreductase n=1 Tax=Avibacterium avium TaxID=751 RepID=UPI003BF8F40E